MFRLSRVVLEKNLSIIETSSRRNYNVQELFRMIADDFAAERSALETSHNDDEREYRKK